MSAHDYTCATGCGETAVAVVIMGNGFYGECAEHLQPLEPGHEWLWAPCPTCKGRGYLPGTLLDAVLGVNVVPCPDCVDGTVPT